MARRLEFNWIPFVKFFLVLSVYVFAGGFLMFFLEECAYDQLKSLQKSTTYTGNITSICIRLAGKMIDSLNRSEIAETGSVEEKVFINQCQKMLENDEKIIQGNDQKCLWEWRNIRKWIKFVYASLATIGYPDLSVKSQVGKGFFTAYMLIGVPFSVLCYIHFGRIIRCTIRRTIRKVEGHFFNRKEPRNLRHKVIFYNAVLIILTVLIPSIILKMNGEWTFVDCLYYFTGIISTAGHGQPMIDTKFFNRHHGFSILLDAFQILGLGLVSSIIQAGAGLHRAKHKRGRLPLQRNNNAGVENQDTRNDVINGTVAMDSLVILVRNGQEQLKFD